MNESFKLYSETNPDAKKFLKPILNLRNLDDLSNQEKKIMYNHLYNKGWLNKSDTIVASIHLLNDYHKHLSPGINILNHGGPHKESSKRPSFTSTYFKNCCIEQAFLDLKEIFFNQSQFIIFELLSIYAKLLKNNTFPDSFNLILAFHDRTKGNIKNFEQFKNDLNEIFEQFSINVYLTHQGFIPRQEDKIINEIYEPVLNILSDSKWEAVNRELNDAFKEYTRHESKSYSNCITHAVTAFQAFLQIIINKEIGKGKIEDLINSALKEQLIPNNSFSKPIIKNIQSILSENRQKYGDAHPKQEYANEKNAKLVLNLLMVFFQHALQK